MKILFYFSMMFVVFVGSINADTIVNTKTGETYHGYLTGLQNAGLSDVNTVEKGLMHINLTQYKVTRDRTGRNNLVVVISEPDAIMLGMETSAFEDALKQAAARGPLFIIIEIDSPGGRTDLCKRMCATVKGITNCDTFAYINGGSHGGAYSAAAVLSMSCDKIYMAPGTVIGAATVITMDANGTPTDLKKVLGETVGEKMHSAWRNYMASMAESRNRPAVLALAMENKDLEVVEVNESGKRVFKDAVNKKPNETVVKTWSKKGELLTLPANEAIGCGMADKIYANRQDLLADHNALDAQIVCDETMEKSRELYKKIDQKLKKLDASIDLGLKRFDATQSRVQAMKALKSIIYDAQYALSMKKRFGDDIPINEEKVQDFLNDAQAVYDSIRTAHR